jgi:hypothetical protein
MERMVGHVWQVDSGVGPDPQHLLLRTVSAQGLAGRRPCQSGAAIRVQRSRVGPLIQDHGMNLEPGRPLGRGRRSRLPPTGRSAGRDRGPGRHEGSHGTKGWSFDPCAVSDYPECQREVGPLGNRIPGPINHRHLFSYTNEFIPAYVLLMAR